MEVVCSSRRRQEELAAEKAIGTNTATTSAERARKDQPQQGAALVQERNIRGADRQHFFDDALLSSYLVIGYYANALVDVALFCGSCCA